jgi:cyclopropane-fatty-acyl-phospholipid synthase
MFSPHTPLERDATTRSAEEQIEFERRNVANHYEHDADIFSLVLDSQLTYSTGIFQSSAEDLETAQQRKFAHVRNLLRIRPGEQVFDAGCGWGSILLYLAEHTEGRFHGVTLSAKQREVALARARQRGIDDRLQIDIAHVGELDLKPHSLDVIIFSGSIVHMHDREGIHEWAATCLRPGGRMLISDCYFPAKPRGSRESEATEYILGRALGYCRLLTLSEELGLIEKNGLDVRLVEDLTSSYVHTVSHWINNIRRHRPQIEALAPGFAHLLQCYMTIGRLSFLRRTALEYMIVATKEGSNADLADWSLNGLAAGQGMHAAAGDSG